MILSRNSDVKSVVVKSIEGKPVYGGALINKPLIKGDEMTLLEVHYMPGAGSPLHVHSHESLVYVVKGKVRMKVGAEEYVLGPGDVCRHPKGVPHSVEGIEESVMVEIKSPAPEISSFLGT
jgi:quercetin dioxygenase-like cupin family protein